MEQNVEIAEEFGSRKDIYKSQNPNLYWEADPKQSDGRNFKCDVTSAASHVYMHDRRNIFDKLTDPRYYTGCSRSRFDEYGNGRGLAGREDLVYHDGCTESSLRTHEVYSSVIKKPRKFVVTPGTMAVQKFGVQVSPPKLIWVYRNGDKHHSGEGIFVRNHIRTINELCAHISNTIKPIAGPGRSLYDQNLKRIRSLTSIVDGGKYLLTSGEPPTSFDRLQKFLSAWVVQ